MKLNGWWLVAGGWWLVAGGWWLVAGGWWLVAGEVMDLSYPARREFFGFAVENPPSQVPEGLITFDALPWGAAFPDFSKLVVLCCLKIVCSFAASVSAARAHPPLVMPLSEDKRRISLNVAVSTEVLISTESLPGLLVFLGMKSRSKILQDFQFFCLTLIRILIRKLATGVNAPGKSNENNTNPNPQRG